MIKLTEDRRTELINISKKADNYAANNQSLGKNRYERRLKSKVKKSVKELNSIDMNKLFKDNILDVNLRVEGETSEYIVSISFGSFLDVLHSTMGVNSEKLELQHIIRALVASFNNDNVYIHCTCEDWKYRMAYFATVKDVNYIKGEQTSNGKGIANPNDTKGRGCKHVLLVLSNTSWLTRLASVIYNYVNYMQKHYEQSYADIIYPAIFQRDYDQDVQMDMFSDGDLKTDSDEIDVSNKWARTKTQFKKDNPYRFTKKDIDAEPEEGQLSIDDIER